MKKKVTMIDPPSGWKYGFPKPIPENRHEDIEAWLIEEGYPKSLIDELGPKFWISTWEEEIYVPSLLLYVNVGDGAIMDITNPQVFKQGEDTIEWIARYGNIEEVRYSISMLLDSYKYLISDNITTTEAIRRLRILRQKYKEVKDA